VAKPCTKFEFYSFSSSEDTSWDVKFWNWSRDPDHAPFGDGCWPKANTWYSLQPHKIWRLYVPEIFQGLWNYRMHHVALTTPT